MQTEPVVESSGDVERWCSGKNISLCVFATCPNVKGAAQRRDGLVVHERLHFRTQVCGEVVSDESKVSHESRGRAGFPVITLVDGKNVLLDDCRRFRVLDAELRQ